MALHTNLSLRLPGRGQEHDGGFQKKHGNYTGVLVLLRLGAPFIQFHLSQFRFAGADQLVLNLATLLGFLFDR